MKKLLTWLLIAFTAVSLAACGQKADKQNNETKAASSAVSNADDAQADETAADDSQPDETASDAGQTDEAAGDEEAADDSAIVTSLNDAQARLISFYHTDSSTYIMAAYQRPQYTAEDKPGWKDSPYHDVSQHFEAGGEYTNSDTNFFYHGDWKIVFTCFEGTSCELGDMILSVTDYDEEEDLKVDFTFSEADLLPEGSFSDFGLYKMGSRYVILSAELIHDYNSYVDRYVNCRVHINDISVQDQDSRLTPEEIDPEAFTVYAGDGTTAEDLFGTSCEREEVSRLSKGDYNTSTLMGLYFRPQETDGTKEEQTARVDEMLEKIRATEPYLTYTDPDGNVFTIPISN